MDCSRFIPGGIFFVIERNNYFDLLIFSNIGIERFACVGKASVVQGSWGLQPFLKWAGGKRWLFDDEFVAQLPAFKRYVEPFLGGGAGFFALEPQKALLSDLNPDLINLYEVVRDRPLELQAELACHHQLHCSDYYYKVRSRKPRGRIKAAAWMLYLNRTCWNGLYRLNRAGTFNVPIGTKSMVCLPTDDFVSISKALSDVILKNCDFEETINKTKSGDLIFVDPPYTVKHNMNGFVKYNETIFSWADQVRLRDALVRASNRGAAVVLTNADHASIRELYEGFGDHSAVSRRSVISGKSTGRSEITEFMVRA